MLADEARLDGNLRSVVEKLRIGDLFSEAKFESLERVFKLHQAVANGAAGIQTKGSPTADLLKTIRAIASGKTTIPPELTAKGQPAPVSLSKRQKQILLAVSLGFNSEDIARQLGISVSGVKWNITDACEKLGAATRAEAAALAIRQHLLD